MAIKIRKKSARARERTQRRRIVDGREYIEVGRGPYQVVTINRHDGSTVVQRFKTAAEAEAQNRRNMAADKPLVGVGPLN